MTYDTEELKTVRPKKKKKKKHVFLWIFLVILLAAAGAGGGAYLYYSNALKPVKAESEEVIVEIPESSTVRSVTSLLADQGVIRDGQMAYYFARINDFNNIYPGKYALDKSWNVEEVLTYLGSPANAINEDVRVTIIEGDWAKHIAVKLAEVTGISADEYMALWKNRDWIESIRPSYPFLTDEIYQSDIYLEGYLAPDTYQLKKDSTAEEVTLRILDQTNAVYQEFAADMAESELSIHEIYTLASIIQYEAGGSEPDQRLISGVFMNRLHYGWNLQSSVTVCYAIDYDKDSDNWQSCEINVDVDSPYNTYMYPGLTPGPIENPGRAQIYAALHPEYTDPLYFFFMADVYGDGTIYYAATEDEHYANVAKYLGG